MAKDFYDLFVNELKDAFSAESQITEALPGVIQKATSKKLKEALQDHLKETKQQLQRLEKIGSAINEELTGHTCQPIKSILAEGEKTLSKDLTPDIRDAAIINSCQRIEHYEIAMYGILKAFAKHLKLEKVEKLLCESAKEEGHADKKLTEIAEGTFFSKGVNDKACKKAA